MIRGLNDQALVSILILARNESIHIARAIESAHRLTPHVYVLDSDSKDGTAAIAESAGALVISGTFDGFSEKLNWGADNIDFPTPWVFRLDADEILTEELIARLPKILAAADSNTCGIYVRRQLWFMGHWLRHGGMYPTQSMRIWRRRTAYCESRALDEHMILRQGRASSVALDVVDNPLFDITTWIDKHNRYATLEAESAIQSSFNHDEVIHANIFGTLPQKVRWIKVNVFYRLPIFVRPFLYFFYRFFLRLGFLDGKTGFVFHFMHGLWYRLLVDAKIFEARLAQKSIGNSKFPVNDK